MYGLKEKHIKAINSVFSKYPQIEKTILYGSRAKGNYRNGSDIDLTLVGDDLDLSTLFKIETKLDDLLLPYKMDLSILHKVENQDLVDHIKRVGITFYEKMMSEWIEVKLGDKILTNQRTVGKDYSYNDIKYLDTGSITEGRIEKYQDYKIGNAPSRAKRLVKNDDIIYSTVRPINRHYGYITNPPENLVVSTGFTVITCKEEIDSRFLYYYLTSDESIEFLHSIAEGSTSTYPSLKPSDIEALEIDIPSDINEQKQIASILTSLDDKIDLLHRQNKTLEAMAETLFREWFVENTEEDWEEGVLQDEFDFTMGQSPLGSTFNEDGEGISMYQGNRDFEFRFPTKRVYTTDPKRFALKFDTLISVRAPVGAQNMANEKCCIGRGVAAFRYKSNSEFYTYTYFKIRSLMDEIKKFNDEGTVFGSIGKSDFEKLNIVLPPSELVEKYQNEVKPIDDKVILNCGQIYKLEKLRDTLLPKLMSGEIKVENI